MKIYTSTSRTSVAMAMIVLLAVVSTVGCAYTTIPPGHAGILVQQTGPDRGVQDVAVSSGRVFYNPFNEDVLDYPTNVQRAIWTKSTHEGAANDEEIAFQSSDGLHFTGDVAVGYHIPREAVPKFYIKFRNDDLAAFTHGFFRDVVRKCIGESAKTFTAEQINGVAQAALEKNAQDCLTGAVAGYGVVVDQLAFTSPPRPPDQVRFSIEAKIAATQKAEQIENEKRQAVAEGQKTVALAEAASEANDKINRSITPQLIQWRQLQVMSDKWDGKLPQVTGGGTVPLLQLPTR